jgi:hypothetical protein
MPRLAGRGRVHDAPLGVGEGRGSITGRCSKRK